MVAGKGRERGRVEYHAYDKRGEEGWTRRKNPQKNNFYQHLFPEKRKKKHLLSPSLSLTRSPTLFPQKPSTLSLTKTSPLFFTLFSDFVLSRENYITVFTLSSVTIQILPFKYLPGFGYYYHHCPPPPLLPPSWKYGSKNPSIHQNICTTSS